MAALQSTFASVSPPSAHESLLSDSSEERKEVPSHMAACFSEDIVGYSEQKFQTYYHENVQKVKFFLGLHCSEVQQWLAI